MTNDHANNDSGKRSMDPSVKGFNASESMDDLLLIREKYKSLYERKLHCIYVHDLEGNFLDSSTV